MEFSAAICARFTRGEFCTIHFENEVMFRVLSLSFVVYFQICHFFFVFIISSFPFLFLTVFVQIILKDGE